MSFDGMMTYAISKELSRQLETGRIVKIYQPYERELVFHIRVRRQNVKCFMSANPSSVRVHVSTERLDNPQHAPMFCMLLRKHLEGGLIETIEQVDMERIIHMDVRTKDELGEVSFKRLIIEIMGRHSNIILVDPERNMILDSIHHVTHAVNQHRVLLPGREYITPPAQHKMHPFDIDYEAFIKKINFNQGKLDKQIVQQFSGVSPLLAKEIVHQAGLPNRESLYESFSALIHKIKNDHVQPTIITNPKKSYFYLFPLEHIEGDQRTFPSISAMLEQYYRGKSERDRVKQRAHDLFRFLSNEKSKNKNKIKKLQSTDKESEKAGQYQLYGELMTAYMHQIKRGDSSIEVVNYYDPEGATITIPLNTELTPNENAQAYFKKYNKLKNSKTAVEKQIGIATKEIEYFENLLQQLDHASPKDIEEMREELIEGGYLRKRTQQKKTKKPTQPQPEKFTSSEGIPILVGKNNKQNDFLSNRLGRATDTWLHTKDIPGSHVLIRDDQFSEQTLLEAAQLAAYFSKARDSSQVPVDYTLIRHVKKPNGAKPGYVIYDNQKTVYVTPSEELVQSLKGD